MSSGQALSRYSLFWLLKLTVNLLLTAAVYVYRVALCASLVYAILILSVCVHMSILVLAITVMDPVIKLLSPGSPPF